MIDLHCHILPAMDDGPQTEADSLQMARTFDKAGYRIVAATPHMVPGTAWMPAIERVENKIDGLNRAIGDLGLGLQIVPGMEIALDPQIPTLLDEERLLPLGGATYLLIEPSFQQLPPGWEQVIFAIQAKGYQVQLAHPERCAQLAAEPERIGRLMASGVYLQVNLGSFLGHYGKAVARTARLLAANGWIHCLSTDSHHPGDPGRFAAVRSKLDRMIGHENIALLTMGNPRRVLDGEPLQSMQPCAAMQKQNPWWKFW